MEGSSTKFTPSKVQNLTIQIVNFQKIFGILPISYNSRTGLFHHTKSKFRRYVFAILIYLQGIDLCYLFLNSGNITLKTVDEKQFVSYFMHTISRCAAWVIASFLLWSPNENLYFLNLLFHIDEKLLGK